MNIYDIAAEAGTSISTVSRVLNNKGNVNPKIRDRVEAVLKKYDYKPSAIARGMVSKTMKNIAILTVDVRVTHYARMIYVIEQEFSIWDTMFPCAIQAAPYRSATGILRYCQRNRRTELCLLDLYSMN